MAKNKFETHATVQRNSATKKSQISGFPQRELVNPKHNTRKNIFAFFIHISLQK